MKLLSVRDLALTIGPARPVDGVDFDIGAGETFALLGESGCGKSMTALALMRLLPPGARINRGSVMLEEAELLDLTEAQMRQRRGGAMAMIFQEPATSLNPVLTIGQQIAETLALHRNLGGSAARQRGVELLQTVGIPDPARRYDEYPFQLSGGMKQRAMIAMALAGEPRLLIADEPTTALDVTIQAQVLDVLVQLQRQQGMAMLLITHDLGVVARMADRIGVMYAGQLVEVASREDFFARPRHPYSRKLFEALPDARRRGGRLTMIPGRVPPADADIVGCRFAERCDRVMDQCRELPPPWREAANGQRMRCHLALEEVSQPTSHEEAVRPESSATAAALLEVRDLRVHFPIRRGILQRVRGQVRAVDGISLSLSPGRTLALVGESGCGKTTAGKAILQLLAPTAGSVRLAGRELTDLTAGELRPLRGTMQMVFQDPYASLDPRMRVGGIIAEGMAALGLKGDHRQLTERLLEQVGLAPEMALRYPHEFSGGQRQRIAIARALAVNPQILICDEPTSALDVSVQAQILNLLQDLQASLGLAYLFITHNIAVVDYLAHEVAVMYLGRVVEQGTVDEILRQPCHPYTRALIAAVPRIDGQRGEVLTVAGDPPSPAQPPTGCHFHPRCPEAMDICRRDYPGESRLSSSRGVRCHLYPGPD
ncbi:dipeptide ABC transporter ATP-binding protein [Denitratisoma oestradiolicum]|uniref:Putative peptide transport fused subunits of ABC superfamily: ATP-binding components n=1 Tax=Denitratisoma oestradiolicum TaxID=311182 RepID=A0A6S6Y8R6_9PROT|nr:dipeptide ABC transporter ATP-binding protein [Denitratisoma oestradiolicum]TWO81978.1 ABC transporter ATP-binding protein [Denitratisoma oestradiolicum]CAB1368888.1 putative peptide transport fused subunits of ABC superfamily: ATP-binding components [Denitratisoma oestradiolicum]